MRCLCRPILILVSCIVLVSAYELDYNITELEETHQCTSQIYCHGELLNTIQMARINPDSKTFVDMKLKAPPAETLQIFNKWYASFNGDKPTKEDVQKFVNENFDPPGSEFEDWTPADWVENPKFIDTIQDDKYRQWGKDLNLIWKELSRKMTDHVKENPDLYSIIYVDNPVVVPGGRFREFYYWDSYWIIRGLLHCEMYETAKGMLENFISIIERFGYIPNGGRIYYLGRSQPPLLSGMIKSYIEATGDSEFIKQATPALDLEYQYFLNNHMIEVNGHMLAKYGEISNGPRPESYVEDITSAKCFNTREAKNDYWSQLKAAAESGMDFSSRWFIKDGTNQGELIDVKCKDIIPVDLNSILYQNAIIISEFYLQLGNTEKYQEFQQLANERYNAVQAVLWHDDVGAWLDYDLINEKRRDYFVPTNLDPLWTHCYNQSDKEYIAEKVMGYIRKNQLDTYPGGVPTTLNKSGQQWDFPNVWPPLQYLLIMGLNGLQTLETEEIAYDWAERWARTNYIVYNNTDAMYEKYLATKLGGYGGGGEYTVQLGFGWTNGVIIELLSKYGDLLSSENNVEDSGSQSSSSLSSLTVDQF